MTDATAAEAAHTPDRRIWLLFLAVALIFAVLVPSQFHDPFSRFDDYPVLLSNPELPFLKTLTEGRWVNYFWSLRPGLENRHAQFAVYMALWSATAAFVAHGIFRGRHTPLALLAAIAFALMPQAANLTAWFATLLPGTFVLCLYARLAALGSTRLALCGLGLAVPVLSMCYSSFPMLALAIAAGAIDWRGYRWGWLILAVVFGSGLVLGALTISGLNWAVHGYFGIAIDPTRLPNPARDFDAAVANLARLRWFLVESGTYMTGGIFGLGPVLAPVIGLAAGVAVLGLVRRSPAAGVTLLVGLAASIAVMAVLTVLNGIIILPRASGFLWAFITAGLALALRSAAWRWERAILLTGLITQIVYGSVVWMAAERYVYSDYQEATRRIASRLESRTAGSEPQRLLLAGAALQTAGMDVLANPYGLVYRLEVLTGWPVHYCTDGDPICAPHWSRLADLPRYPAPGSASMIAAGVMALRLAGPLEHPPLTWQPSQ